MKSFPFNDWLRKAWRKYPKPYLFIEHMDGRVTKMEVGFLKVFGTGALYTEFEISELKIKRCLLVYPGTDASVITDKDHAVIKNILDGRSFTFIGTIKNGRIYDIKRDQPIALPNPWDRLESLLIKQTSAFAQYGGNIPKA